MGWQEITGFLILSIVFLYGMVILYITRALFLLFKAPLHHFTTSQTSRLPNVSLLLPVRNEALCIRECLEGLKLQDYPGDLLEIIVSDDFSEDYTVAIVRNFIRENPLLKIVVIDARDFSGEQPGKKRAIARAVGIATGELMLSTDADTTHGLHWVSAMAAGYSSGKPGMVIGPVAFHREKSLFDKIQSLEFMGLIGTTAGFAAAGYPVMCNGANLAYRRDAYLETGGFSKNIGYDSGDDHFLMAAISKKYGGHSVKFLADREAVVYTQPEDSLQGFINQRLRWVSKSRGYREPVVIGLALITYAVHLFLLAGMVAGVFFPGLLAVSLALWLAKILIEYPIVWRMAGFLNKKHLLGYYFAAQVFQLFYVVLIGMFGTILPHQWKGRRHAG